VWIQRFSDGAGPWFHLHILMPDGVFRAPKNALGAIFEPHPPPTQAEVDGLAETLARRISKLMAKYSNSRPALPRGRIERRMDGTPFSNHSRY
jgi:hypothetical protein